MTYFYKIIQSTLLGFAAALAILAAPSAHADTSGYLQCVHNPQTLLQGTYNTSQLMTWGQQMSQDYVQAAYQHPQDAPYIVRRDIETLAAQGVGLHDAYAISVCARAYLTKP